MKWKSLWEKIYNWELWPFKLRYALITPVWLWYCMRSGTPWFFTPSNPTITFGGFEGEGKKEMYEQLPGHLYPKTIYIQPSLGFSDLLNTVKENDFAYPFIVKPDVGMKGLLFRKIDNDQELEHYHSKVKVDYIIQELVDYPLEVSVFYYRYPDAARGVISGFIQKDLMDVYGDGRSTLWELILSHPKAKHRIDEMRIKHEPYLEKVVPNGERYILTYAANLNRGASFSDLKHLINDDLVTIFDEISKSTSFFYGRYDIKCASLDDFLKGRNFTILEFNGSGAEPNHVYNTGYSLFGAYRVFLHHWKVLYEISRINHLKGHSYWEFSRGWQFLKEAKKHLDLLEKSDTEILV